MNGLKLKSMYYDTSGNYIGFEQEYFQTEIKPVLITFAHNGTQTQAMAKVHNDAFYIVVTGQFEGNLVHINNILK